MSKHKLGRLFFVIFILSVISPSTMASETSELISQAVKSFLAKYEEGLTNQQHTKKNNKSSTERIESSIGYIDQRLNLKPCDTSLTVKLNNPNVRIGRLTTKVSCPTGAAWSIYVPITIKKFQTVLVATRPIPRGTSIGEDHVHLEEKEVSTLYRGYYIDSSQLLSYVTTRALRMNEVISPNNLSAPKLIYRNEEVTIIAKAGGLKVRATGIALSDGTLGQKISVRNKITNKVIEARVKAPGRVEIQI